MAGSYVVDLTWVSDDVGWALAAAPCSQGVCPRLTATTDGGATWSRLPDPPAAIQTESTYCAITAPCVSHVRFASRMIGYLYGPALLTTDDGGKHWRTESSPPVEALEPSGGSVFRVVYDHGGCPGPCDRSVQMAAAGSDMWKTLLAIPFDGTLDSTQGRAELLVQSPRAYVAVYGDLAEGGGSQQAVMYSSADDGAHWRRSGDPCGAHGAVVNDAVAIAAAPSSFLATLCESRTGSGFFVITSLDGGTVWSGPHPVPGAFLGLMAAPSPGHLAVATGPVSGYGPTTYDLLVSSDGGVHWDLAVTDRESLPINAPGAGWLGFEDARVGRWVGFEESIWMTVDAGAHWIRRLP